MCVSEGLSFVNSAGFGIPGWIVGRWKPALSHEGSTHGWTVYFAWRAAQGCRRFPCAKDVIFNSSHLSESVLERVRGRGRRDRRGTPKPFLLTGLASPVAPATLAPTFFLGAGGVQPRRPARGELRASGQDRGHPGGAGGGLGRRTVAAAAPLGCGGLRRLADAGGGCTGPPAEARRPPPAGRSEAGALRPAPGSAGEGTLSAGPAGSRSRERRRAPQPF